ncbi:hypothetical protein [Rickettsia rickettsii]|nr:hypothetical protein [Rickettsia rickettsii]AJG33804.1 hypothetical protein RRR_05510 [Rickettsia rickettsii str. R]AJG35145.1 hypothetical protein RRM_05535 [Rickettsia rickettsii str. Morgan]USD86505.1 hypothetical protein NDY48_05530 [Rickettsia rickettsii]USD87819.1 hypothetical protein NDY49_05575 [Rickettsia rickettsii]
MGVIALRSYVIDEKDPWYELCALPTTNLAMLQILLSFPVRSYQIDKLKR